MRSLRTRHVRSVRRPERKWSAVNKRERVDAALRGEAVDRVPISFWGHDYMREWSAEGLAEAMLTNYRTLRLGLHEGQSRAPATTWKTGARHSSTPPTPITATPGPRGRSATAADWRNAASAGARPRRARRAACGAATDPRRTRRARRTSSRRSSRRSPWPSTSSATDPEPVKHGHRRRARGPQRRARHHHRDLRHLLAACLEAGASGIFFATTGWAPRRTHRGRVPRVRDSSTTCACSTAVAGSAPFNVLHNCGDRHLLRPARRLSGRGDQLGDDAARESRRSPRARRARTKAVMGGVSEKTTLPDGTPEDVANEVRQALAETEGVRLLLAPGCSIPPRTPAANLAAAAQAARNA